MQYFVILTFGGVTFLDTMLSKNVNTVKKLCDEKRQHRKTQNFKNNVVVKNGLLFNITY